MESLICFFYFCPHWIGGFTLNCLRNSDFSLINGNFACKSKNFKCVMCRKLKGKLGTQKQRIQNVPPFSYSGLDIFGPVTMKYRRTELKEHIIILPA